VNLRSLLSKFLLSLNVLFELLEEGEVDAIKNIEHLPFDHVVARVWREGHELADEIQTCVGLVIRQQDGGRGDSERWLAPTHTML
jgi:hypothetical protein